MSPCCLSMTAPSPALGCGHAWAGDCGGSLGRRGQGKQLKPRKDRDFSCQSSSIRPVETAGKGIFDGIQTVRIQRVVPTGMSQGCGARDFQAATVSKRKTRFSLQLTVVSTEHGAHMASSLLSACAEQTRAL